MRHSVTFVFCCASVCICHKTRNRSCAKARCGLCSKEGVRCTGLSCPGQLDDHRWCLRLVMGILRKKGKGERGNTGRGKPQRPPRAQRWGSQDLTSWSETAFPNTAHFIFDLHFPYFPELWAVYRVRRIFALT